MRNKVEQSNVCNRSHTLNHNEVKRVNKWVMMRRNKRDNCVIECQDVVEHDQIQGDITQHFGRLYFKFRARRLSGDLTDHHPTKLTLTPGRGRLGIRPGTGNPDLANLMKYFCTLLAT